MGRRYSAIVKVLGHDVVQYDIADVSIALDAVEYDKAIVATPTDTHYNLCAVLADYGKPILCEKPVSKNIDEVKNLVAMFRPGTFFVVCNWKYLAEMGDSIVYDYYKTGVDGLWWDMFQPIYLAGSLMVRNRFPVFNCLVNRKRYTQRDFDLTYMRMIADFVNGGQLWNGEDAIKATKKVLKVIGEQNERGRNTSKNWIEAVS